MSVDHSVITPEELHARNFTNLYDAIQALRGNWLRTRGNDSFETPSIIQVYLDNQRMGGLEQLRSLNPRSVYSVQYFDGIAATARWGLNHGAGAIFVTSQR